MIGQILSARAGARVAAVADRGEQLLYLSVVWGNVGAKGERTDRRPDEHRVDGQRSRGQVLQCDIGWITRYR
jgi:hypothetical protein